MADDPTTATELPPPAFGEMAPAAEPVTLRDRPPRAGELTATWRVIVALTWLGVGFAFGAVWNTSDQLGLSTWWLGPRGDPNPRWVQVLPFVPAVVMVVIAANRVRYAAWIGVIASVLVIAIGIADLSHVARLGWIEVAIGVAAGAVSLAATTATYRQSPS